ncbi:Ig-like domain-containing protein [Lactiplantibacillus sp. WILCCON 0030]|uniref:Ig-like domain-containing protein n=1 Tax=Lactiplantibacillus brownii TaxID=3069269 RepID=A0ABU1A5Y5_9LACO|nr:Ig-like domain-containing protein [Lactiplantibacillus brownii]MDQ7936338.1 Ig-like domain-containing protein [Lactiplantibacillus brownii]
MMRKFWRYLLLAITGLALMVLSPPILGQAKEITSVVGLDVNSAVIKDANGKVYSNDAQLPKGEYTVNYAWSIPNGTDVRSGDTMIFQLPQNINIPEPDDFSLTSSSGSGTIGRAHIDQGASYGVITLNRYLQTNTKNRKGWIKVSVESKATEPDGPISMSKTASWVDPTKPNLINWQLAVRPDGNTLTNPVIKDTFSGNQKYVAGSVKATDAAGQNIPVTASGSLLSNTMTFKLSGSYTTDITLTYQTRPKLATGADTFNNNATYTDDGGHQASANASIDREGETTPPENPGTDEPGQKEPIAMSKSVSWADPEDQTKLNWSVEINDNGNKLVNPQIVDHLSKNQTYVDGSAKLVNAYGDKVMVAVSQSSNGQSLVFSATGTFTTNLHLTYQTTTTGKGAETFSNDATYKDDNGNNANATAEIDRTVVPEEPTKEPITMAKSVAWADPKDQTKLNWKLAISANGNKLVNPTIVDKMSANQTFVDGSARAVTATGATVPVIATANGTEITFKLSGTYEDNFDLTYQTTTDEADTAATYANVAVYEDEANNNASADASIDRDATEVEPAKDPISMTKEAAWSDPNDRTKINWTLAIKANDNQLINPVITDELSDNQTYVSDSAQAVDEDGQRLPLNVSVAGNVITFSLAGKFETNMTITYQTKTNKDTGAATFDNAALYTDDDGNNASADSSIDRPAVEEPEEPGTTEPEEPGTTEPEEPGTTEPEMPGTTEPEKPGTTEPEEPGTTEPEMPGTTEPEKPGTTEPEMPGTTEPGKPGTTEPEMPGTTEPEKPGTTEPEMPGTTEPQQPGTTIPVNPDMTAPSTTMPTTPNAPATATPSVPNTIMPNGNGATNTPAPYSPASGRLPQTSEHRNSAVDTILGCLALVLILVLGYLGFRRQTR